MILLLSGGVVCAAWLVAVGGQQFALLAGFSLTVVVAAWLLPRPPQGALQWNGRQWLWESGGVQAVVTVHRRLDWQRGMLLEVRKQAGRPIWLWLESRAAPDQWAALRRALHAQAASLSNPGADPREGGWA